MIHELKTLPQHFKAVKDEVKTFEISYNDRNYQVGDILMIGNAFTGERVTRVITYITDYGQSEGQVVMGMKKVMVDNLPFEVNPNEPND